MTLHRRDERASAVTLPILTLDEHALDPRLGYVFQRTWLQPYESLVGMLWKFAHMNRLPGHLVMSQLCSHPIDPYEGAVPASIDVARVARMLGISRRIVREGICHATNDTSPFLRFCPSCISAAYHSRLFQLERHARCPIHGDALRDVCRRCGRSSAFRLDSQLLDAPFRCKHCRRCYSSLGYAPPTVYRCLAPKARAAVTRAAIG
ncbi:hypothetical protein [Variovorax sp. dw_308]|uniref:hypothetical protein n=1 Tax=Variovorax sp. dw_308 TaxID=2721546 RepID=UPI001C46912F|nr:hypothetical protein [Variovorax sp. dw_308]